MVSGTLLYSIPLIVGALSGYPVYPAYGPPLEDMNHILTCYPFRSLYSMIWEDIFGSQALVILLFWKIHKSCL
jgi:hypothetical protein